MSKSGLTVSYELEVKAGVVDPDFMDNLGVVLRNNSNKYFKRVAGDPIAQLLFIKIATPTLVQVPVLAKTQHGEHGFGRTLQNKLQIRKQFQKALQILLDTFYDTILLYTQNIHVVNFSDIARGFVNVVIKNLVRYFL